MKFNSAQELVSEMTASLKMKAEKEKDPNLKKIAISEVEFTEAALLSIFIPFENKQYKQAGEATVEFADWLGASGLANIITVFTEEKMKPLAPFREYFLYAAGMALRASGDAPSALDFFQVARRTSLRHNNYSLAAKSAIDIGVAYFDKGKPSRAKSWYMKASREAEAAHDTLTMAKALNNIGAMLIDDDPMEARQLLEQSITLKKKAKASEEEIIPSLFNLGVLYAQAGERKKAYKIFKQSAQYTESEGDAYNLIRSLLNVGNEAAALGDFKEAASYYSKGIDLAKTIRDLEGERMLHQGFAVSASRFEDYELASKEFKAFYNVLGKLGYKEEAAIALHDLSLCLARDNKKNRARKYLDKAVNSFIDQKNIDWQRRCLLLFATDIEDWLSDNQLYYLRKAVYLRGGNDKQLRLNAIREYWNVLLECGDLKEAHKQLNRELAWLKNDREELSDRLHRAGMTLLDKGHYSEALRHLNKALKVSIADDLIISAGIRQDLALAYAEVGEFVKSLDLFRLNVNFANKTKNRVLKATNIGNLGEVERRAGNISKSILHLNEAVKLTRSYNDLRGKSFWLNNLALSLIETGEFRQTINVLNEGLKAAKEVGALPEHARILGTFGILEAERGRFEKAISFYTKSSDTAYMAGEKIFAMEMQLNRAAALRFLDRREQALSDAYKIIDQSSNLRNYEMTSDVAQTAAIWCIEWKRPVKAGELSAFSIMSGVMTEGYDITQFMALVLLSLKVFSEKKYAQFYRSLRKEIEKREVGDLLMKNVTTMEAEINRKFQEGLYNHSMKSNGSSVSTAGNA